MMADDLKRYAPDVNKPVVERVTVDFVEILKFLRSRGYGVNTIAMHANVPRSSVRDYCDGTTPSHPQGERIIRFWCEITGNNRGAVPVRREGAVLTASRF